MAEWLRRQTVNLFSITSRRFESYFLNQRHIVQWLERTAHNGFVMGSIPIMPIQKFKKFFKFDTFSPCLAYLKGWGRGYIV